VADAAPEALRRRYSDGYRIDVAADAPARADAARALAGATVVADEPGGLRLTTPELGPDVLAALGALAARHPEADIHVQRPEMPDVFRRVLAAREVAP
jgi:hypothetical protein